ncbi:MAG: restriction endonuclease subunit S [Chloroflexi bacterium]|nr:restriction endonuclease subunit S [Chloroflexota bacterium]
MPLGYKHTEVGVIPEDWHIVEIGDLKPFVTSGSRGWARFYSDTGVSFIRITNLSRQAIDLDLSDMKFVVLPLESSAEALRTELRDGDLLISITADIGIIGFVDSRIPKPAYINQHIALIRFDQSLVSSRFAAYSLTSERPQRLFRASMDIGAKAGMSLLTVRKIRFALPPLPEQRAIADALTDVDGLIRALEKLIAKKRTIKQAMMKQLLTGKSRLPGFSKQQSYKQTVIGVIPEDWMLTNLERVSAFITKGSTPTTYGFQWVQDGVLFLRSECVSENGLDLSHSMFISQKAHALLNRSELRSGDILITITGNVGRVVYLNNEFSFANMNQHIARVRIIDESVSTKFVYYFLTQNSVRKAFNAITTGQAYPQISLKQVREAVIPLPPLAEQRAIAAVLSDMDAELAALEQRLYKTRQLKQSMMQQLLTGRVRLLNQEASTGQARLELAKTKAHNWQINEAVVIAVLANQFGSEQYPLGRKRYTKLSYLFHRHAEHKAEGYLKKAAGPYNPRTRYGGPEKIAIQNRYLQEHTNAQLKGFVAGDNIAQAEDYFDNWYGVEARQWLEQFRYKPNDELELLATVDMAVEELRDQGAEVTVTAIKGVIKANKEWEAKLSRDVFSDDHIAEALETCRVLFDARKEELR